MTAHRSSLAWVMNRCKFRGKLDPAFREGRRQAPAPSYVIHRLLPENPLTEGGPKDGSNLGPLLDLILPAAADWEDSYPIGV